MLLKTILCCDKHVGITSLTFTFESKLKEVFYFVKKFNY